MAPAFWLVSLQRKINFLLSPCWKHLSGHCDCGPRFHLLDFLGSLGVSNYWFYRHWLLCIKDLYGAWAQMVSSRHGVLNLDPFSVLDSVFKEISFFWADRKCLLSWIIIDFLHVVSYEIFIIGSPFQRLHGMLPLPVPSASCNTHIASSS